MKKLHRAADMQIVGKRILIVDDDEITLMTLGGMAHRLGVDAELALGGLRGIECFEASHFDLVLLDIHMPGMNGFQTVRRMRTIQRENPSAHVDIVAFSAGISSRMTSELLSAGFSGVCPKPITLTELRQLLLNGIPRATLSTAEVQHRESWSN